ncbi:MAG: GntR family transcriptional regulator [Clostridia bacterium]|jgi:GntR family transcriptional regulator
MINKFNGIPLYSQLKNLIIKKIEDGEYAEDGKIPSEQVLCETYSISRPTVRQAINELTNSGYIYKEKGKGTFVAKKKSSIDIKEYSGFTDSILDSQSPGDKNIIAIKVMKVSDNPFLKDSFESDYVQNSEFAEIKYSMMENGDVYSLNTSYLPLNLFPEIIEDIKTKKPSYDILRGKYPLLPTRSKSTLEISYTEQADAEYLQVLQGQPLIKIENILYSKNGQAVELIISKYRADKCKLIFENSK